jgi:HAD superfamily hydrolase (TIGR01509 family)
MGVLETIQAVMFDLDGVLIHSASIHAQAFDRVFRDFGITSFDYAPYAGWRTLDVVTDVFARHDIPASPDVKSRAAATKSKLARQMLEERAPLDRSFGPVLAQLASTYPIALASSGSRASVELFLRSSGSASLFRSVLTSEDVERAKPCPDLYVASAAALGVEPSRCLVVEDAVAGVKAGRASGATVVGIPGLCSVEELRNAGADYVISQLDGLPELLRCARLSSQPDRSCWTAVVPAAGRGSRLGYHLPKILFPVAGRPILDWLLDFLGPNCSRFVFVVSPDGSTNITAELDRRIPGAFDVVIQEHPTGMGDAVALALPLVRTPHTAVVWGDQAALRPESVQLCMRLHQGPLNADATFPTVLRNDPYIHFERDAQGRIEGLKQKREGDAMPEQGESDTGFFCFRTSALSRNLACLRSDAESSGAVTGEFNFLPVLPLMSRRGTVLTPRIMSLEETIGVNDTRDATILERFLLNSHGHKN